MSETTELWSELIKHLFFLRSTSKVDKTSGVFGLLCFKAPLFTINFMILS